MAVYFVYRSHYNTPALNHLRRFEDESVLAWFRRNWKAVPDRGASAHVQKLFGCRVYGFRSLFNAIAEHSLPAPPSDAALRRLLDEHLYVEQSLLCRPHAIQVLTDDDELELAYYFFDDHFLASHGNKAAFLLREDWQLPEGAGEAGLNPPVPVNKLAPPARGAGATYLAFLAWYDSGSLTDIEGAYVVPGVRLPGLPRYLATTAPPPGYKREGGWPFELRLLRSQLLQAPAKMPREEKALLAGVQDSPADEARWLVYADWLEEHGQSRNALLERALRASGRYPVGTICNSLSTRDFRGNDLAEARKQLEELVGPGVMGDPRADAKRARVQAGQHVAQLSLVASRGGDTWHRWIIFDDLWAGAHPALATAILRYAGRWDVLS